MADQDSNSKTFKTAFWWTAGVIVVLSIASTALGYAMADPNAGFNGDLPVAMFMFWLAAVAVAVAALIAAGVMAARGRKSTAKGIAAGLGVGVLALGATCFANLNVPA